jgi:DNA-binding CsgD family transcriptional regulator
MQGNGFADRLEHFCGSYRLTPRQRCVLAALVAGRAPKEIADDLGVAESTVRFHAIAMYRRCDVRNQREMLALVARRMQPRVVAEPTPERKGSAAPGLPGTMSIRRGTTQARSRPT